MKNILILGANGFIGKHLVNRLVLENKNLVLFARSINVSLLPQQLRHVKIIKGDFHDTNKLRKALQNIDIVFHLISSSVPSSSWETPVTEITDNLIPTIKLLELCVENRVQKVIFLSSAGTVYGSNKGILKEETCLAPFSPYGIVKVTIESYLKYFELKFGLKYDIYRVSNAYGPGLNKKGFGVINTWLKAAKENKEIIVFGNGESRKDYIYVEDVVNVLHMSTIESLNKSQICNISRGKTYSLNEILAIIKIVTKKDLLIAYRPSLAFDNSNVIIDNARMLERFRGYQFVDLKDGIAKIWNDLVNS